MFCNLRATSVSHGPTLGKLSLCGLGLGTRRSGRRAFPSPPPAPGMFKGLGIGLASVWLPSVSAF